MKKRLLSLLLLVCMAFGATACVDNGGNSSVSSPDSSAAQPQMTDYAAQVTLDMNSETLKQEVTIVNHIDGDTTHFRVPTSIIPTGVLKARYLAVNTPESTGQIEEWGKKASNYTKTTLQSAESIIIETDSTQWIADSTGERYLVWVWYKTAEMSDYRCLNIELLQNGLAVGSKASSTRYGEVCVKAIDQAVQLKLHVHSQELDPDYFYGDAQSIDLKELRLYQDKYVNTRVVFEGTVVQYSNQSVYVEDYDEETGLYYGIQVYYGYGLNPIGEKMMNQVGNRVRIAGNFEWSDLVSMYQICDLTYDPFDTESADNIKLIAKNQEFSYKTITAEQFLSDKTVTVTEETEDGEGTNVEKTFKYAELILHTPVAMNNLYVTDAYTTDNGGSNDGAITLDCKVDGKMITVRTAKIYNADGSLVTQDQLVGKTIDVKGIVDTYNGYQIKVFNFGNITIH